MYIRCSCSSRSTRRKMQRARPSTAKAEWSSADCNDRPSDQPVGTIPDSRDIDDTIIILRQLILFRPRSENFVLLLRPLVLNGNQKAKERSRSRAQHRIQLDLYSSTALLLLSSGQNANSVAFLLPNRENGIVGFTQCS